MRLVGPFLALGFTTLMACGSSFTGAPDDGGNAGASDTPAEGSPLDGAGDAPLTTDSMDDTSDAADAAQMGDGPDGCALVPHSNAFESFTDCVPKGTYDLQLAVDACIAYFSPDAGVPCHMAMCGNGVLVVEASNAACIAWAYGGPSTGHVVEGPVDGPPPTCVCPMANDLSWF